MNIKIKWFTWLIVSFKEFISESSSKPEYQIIDVYECSKTGFTKAKIKLSSRHIIEKNISDIVIDNEFLEGLDKKTIRTLTYIATVERMKPDYSIVVQELGNEVDDYLLEIRSRSGKQIIKKSPSEMSKNKELISKLSPVDASRVGYLAGVKETVKEFKMKSDIN